MEARPWERLDKEPEPAYKQFLVFLGLGPERTLLDSYRANSARVNSDDKEKIFEVTPEYRRMAVKWQWEERAAAFNTSVFVGKGLTATFGFIDLVENLVKKLQNKVQHDFDKLSAKMTIPQMMEAIDVLSKFIPQENVRRLLSGPTNVEPELRIAGESALQDGPGSLHAGEVEDQVHPAEDGGSGPAASEAS